MIEKKEVEDNLEIEKSGKVSHTKKYILISISVVFVLLLIAGSSYIFNTFKKPTCGDGSFYETCSSRKPYFCSSGILMEKASICGCPEILTREGDFCISKYQTNPRNIKLNYILRGEENEIDFTVYGELIDYILGLPIGIRYGLNETPSRRDFKLRNINEKEQRELLLPLVIKIQNIAKSKEDQVRIAVSVVQNIPFWAKDGTYTFGKESVSVSRYPYEVLYDEQGICGEKSELLAFILREMGYGVVFFYHQPENHESLGIKCPSRYDLSNSSYCFIETTGPSIITDDSIEYVGGIKLVSEPEIILISEGNSLPGDLYEYKDAKDIAKIREIIEEKGEINIFKNFKLERLRKKYGLVDKYNV